jgi:restriction endonuclease
VTGNPEDYVISKASVVGQQLGSDKENGNQIIATDAQSEEFSDIYYGQIEYGKFLRRLHDETNLDVNELHRGILKTLRIPESNNENGIADSQSQFNQDLEIHTEDVENNMNPSQDEIVTNVSVSENLNLKINEQTLNNLIKRFRTKFSELFAEKYRYDPLNFSASTSVIKGDEIVDKIQASYVGKEKYNLVTDERYLYEECYGDSKIEQELIGEKPIEEVVVFGKLPRKSIKVPTYTGGTTTPDFVYAIKGSDETIQLNLVVETKSEDLRLSEEDAIKSQEKMFAKLKKIAWRKVTDAKTINNILQLMVKPSEEV